MTDFDRRSFMGGLAALFAGFRIKGTPEHELIKATDDFLEDPECDGEEESSTETFCVYESIGCGYNTIDLRPQTKDKYK